MYVFLSDIRRNINCLLYCIVDLLRLIKFPQNKVTTFIILFLKNQVHMILCSKPLSPIMGGGGGGGGAGPPTIYN